MVVLVDTSVWIRFLQGRTEFAEKLDELLHDEQVVGHEFIYGELLIGDVGGRLRILQDYEFISRLPRLPHREVVEFVRARKLHGRGIGWVDAHLLASTITHGAKVWTADPRLQVVAAELGIEYEPTS